MRGRGDPGGGGVEELATVGTRARHGRLSSAFRSQARLMPRSWGHPVSLDPMARGEHTRDNTMPEMVRWRNGAVQRSKPLLDLHSSRQSRDRHPDSDRRSETRGDPHDEDHESDARLRPDRVDGGAARGAGRRPAGDPRRAAAGRSRSAPSPRPSNGRSARPPCARSPRGGKTPAS